MTYRFPIRDDEYWWGGTTITKYCPLSAKSEYHQDFRMSGHNQTATFFVSTLGRYIWSDEPFKVDVTNGEFLIEGGKVDLVEAGSCLRDAYRAAQAAHFPCDGAELPEAFFRGAQYNTWMEMTYYPTQEKVLAYAHEWIDRGYEPGVFIIDEGWHQPTAYGFWEFDFARFPDPKGMIDELHGLGYTVMLWVVPYVVPNGPAYVRTISTQAGTPQDVADHTFMRNKEGKVALIPWWNGYSALLDMTNPYDVKFMDDQLRHLMKDYGVDGFKFDGGTPSNFMSRSVVNGEFATDKTFAELNRAWNEFGRRYAFHEYKDTYCGGGRNVIQRLHDRAPKWTDGGIDDLIPCALTAGMIGHPFICPDMVGGGLWAYRFKPDFTLDPEVFVRSAECSALFPMMQFSWAPWDAVDEEKAAICLEAAKLHSRMAPEILALVKEAQVTGEPILRSLEYNDPHQGYAAVVDEFMLGEDILVAPVVTKGTFEREVLFPAGRWTDEAGNVYEGNTAAVLPAPLDTLLWFRRA